MSAAREHLPPGFEWEEGDTWLMDQYGGRPVTPRELADDEDEEDFARIGAVNFVLEPLAWFFVGFALHGTGWRTIWDILGWVMMLSSGPTTKAYPLSPSFTRFTRRLNWV